MGVKTNLRRNDKYLVGVQAAESTPPVLADAADVLSDQLRSHLQQLAVLLSPHADDLERRFLARLRNLKFDPRQRGALSAITLGSAARFLSEGKPPSAFFEQIEYNGRRLAKLNLPPSDIVAALTEYDKLLTPVLRGLLPSESANFQWVREQMHFCSTLTLNNAYYQVRETETQAFYELFRVELESRNLEELLQRFLQTLVKVCGAEAGNLFFVDKQDVAWSQKAGSDQHGLPLEKLPPFPLNASRLRKLSRARYFELDEGCEPYLLDPSWRERYRSCWSMPITAGGRTAGLLQFAFPRSYEWLPREMELLMAAAERCLMAAEKARLMEDLASREEQIRQLAEHMLHVEEMERRRISRELHDEAGQSLLCIRLQLEMMEQSLPEVQGELRQKLAEARDLTEHTILEMRRLIAALSPAVLEQLGLGAALRQLINRHRRLHPCKVRLHLGRLGTLPKKTEVIVYRLVQECFNNIAKHSQATVVNISVASADKVLKLQVEDNGVGFQVEEALAKRESFGLSGIRERVALLGGTFEVQSRPAGSRESVKGVKLKRGTQISISLPIPAEQPVTEAMATGRTG